MIRKSWCNKNATKNIVIKVAYNYIILLIYVSF